MRTLVLEVSNHAIVGGIMRLHLTMAFWAPFHPIFVEPKRIFEGD